MHTPDTIPLQPMTAAARRRFSRRDFLRQAAGESAGLAAAEPRSLADADRWRFDLQCELAKLHFELRLFEIELLPTILRNQVVKARPGAGLSPVHPQALASYRGAVQRLQAALPTAGRRPHIPDFDAHAALEPVNEVIRSHPLFRWEIEVYDINAQWVGARFWPVNGQLHWQCCSSAPEESHQLNIQHCWALDILDRVNGYDSTFGDPIAAVANSLPKILRWLHTVPSEDLFFINAPRVVFFVPSAAEHALSLRLRDEGMPQHGPRTEDGFFQSWMAWRLYEVLEPLACQHFPSLPQVFELPDIYGCFIQHAPRQLLDILYQKVLVLRWLAGHRDKVPNVAAPGVGMTQMVSCCPVALNNLQ